MNAVVERIANFPKCLPWLVWAGVPQKTAFGERISCNISRGYVARMAGGRGSNSQSDFKKPITEYLGKSEQLFRKGGTDGL